MAINVHLGTVVGSEIKKNIDGENDTRILKCELSSADDVQQIELIQQNGEQNNPLDDATVIVLEITKTWKIAVAIKDFVEPDATLGRGEKIIYSLDSNNNIKAKIYLKNDGTVNIGNGDQFVALSNLVTTALDAICDIFTSGTPVANDGGAALQSAWKTAAAAISTVVASSNLKADE